MAFALLAENRCGYLENHTDKLETKSIDTTVLCEGCMTVNRRMKLDINNLFRHIDEVISNSRSKIARENGFGIAIGLDLLSKYLMEIGELAIRQDNQELIDILVDLHVLKKEEV